MTEGTPWVFCDRMERHTAHGTTCPGTGRCGERSVHEPHLVVDGSLAPYWCFGHRIRLYREKHPTTDERLLRETVWADEPLPVMGGGVMDGAIVGTLTAVRRDSASGWVSALMEIVASGVYPAGMHAEADFDQVEYETRDDGVQVTTGARLRAVTLGDRPCWDEMKVMW